MNRAKVLSTTELNVWKADELTDLPTDDSDAILSDGEEGAEGSPRRSKGAASSLERLPSCWQSIAQFSQGRSNSQQEEDDQPLTALFLDYDGTLREFETRPELAVPTPELHGLLRALNNSENFLVHIISGRDASFLSTNFGRYSRIVLIAEHERRLAGRFQVWRPESDGTDGRPLDWRLAVMHELRDVASKIVGSQVEEKTSSLVWHYRGVRDEAVGNAGAQFLVDKLNQLQRCPEIPALQISWGGHKTVEVSQLKKTKGDIMRRICASRRQAGKPFCRVLIAGDDISDESMFEAAGEDYLTIKVGRDNTLAKYCVDSPEKLRACLWQLLPAPAHGA